MQAHSNHSPPFSLVWRHVAVALVALPVALGLVAWAGPDLVANPRGPLALTAVHLLAIGWMAMVVMGALTQMVPVVLGVPLASHRAIGVSHALTLSGALAMVTGFSSGFHPAVMAGGAAVAVGLCVFAGVMALTVRRVKKWDLTALAVAASLGCMVLGALLGALMALNFRFGFWPALYGAMPAHAHLLVVGWLSTLTAGVSYKLLPMFTLAYGHPMTKSRWALGLIFGGAVAWLPTLLFPAAWPLPAVLQGLGALLYAWDARQLLERRKKRRLETGLGQAARAIALLPLIVGVGALAAFGVPGATGAYGTLLLLGWVSWTLVGYLYKIVPFLVWVDRFSAPSSAGRRPLAPDLVDARLARVAGDALTVGTLALALGFGLGLPWLVQLAAGVAALGAAIAAYDLFMTTQRKGVTPWKPPSATPSKASSIPSSASASSTSA